MSNTDPEKNKFPKLRKIAEGKLVTKRKKALQKNTPDFEREVHIHEIELEMQNEELQATQLKLVESIENYSELFDHAPIGYFILDNNGVILNVNFKGLHLFGLDKKQLIEKPLSIFFNGESCQDDYYRHLIFVLDTNTQCQIESEIRKKDGTIISVSIESNIVKDKKGGFKHLLSTINDISDKKKHEEEVLESKARLEALIDNDISSLWSIDKDYKLTAYNRLCKKIFKNNHGAEIYLGVSMLDHLSSEEQSKWKTFYDKAFAGEHFTTEIVENAMNKDYYFDVSFNPIRLQKNVVGVSVFARDITMPKKTENQLNYKVNELNTFMYKATHDLRSPLASLLGLVKLAKEKADQPDLKNYFDMIDNSAARMDKLLIDLVAIVSVTQGQLNISVINFEEMVDEILESLSNRPGFLEIIFRKNIKPNPLVFRSDTRLVYSILQNIIDNAIKYRRNSKMVDTIILIDVSVNNNIARINITDNGIGIPTEFLEKVFDMFYRATSESTGTGLGLYIVKNTVEKLGGEIRLKSEEKHGTSILITLPNILE